MSGTIKRDGNVRPSSSAGASSVPQASSSATDKGKKAFRPHSESSQAVQGARNAEKQLESKQSEIKLPENSKKLTGQDKYVEVFIVIRPLSRVTALC